MSHTALASRTMSKNLPVQKFRLEKMANGVSYIVTGKNCELTAFQGKIADGPSTVIQPNTAVDLSTVINDNAAADGHLNWNDLPMSFILRMSPRPMDEPRAESTIDV